MGLVAVHFPPEFPEPLDLHGAGDDGQSALVAASPVPVEVLAVGILERPGLDHDRTLRRFLGIPAFGEQTQIGLSQNPISGCLANVHGFCDFLGVESESGHLFPPLFVG